MGAIPSHDLGIASQHTMIIAPGRGDCGDGGDDQYNHHDDDEDDD